MYFLKIIIENKKQNWKLRTRHKLLSVFFFFYFLVLCKNKLLCYFFFFLFFCFERGSVFVCVCLRERVCVCVSECFECVCVIEVVELRKQKQQQQWVAQNYLIDFSPVLFRFLLTSKISPPSPLTTSHFRSLSRYCPLSHCFPPTFPFDAACLLLLRHCLCRRVPPPLTAVAYTITITITKAKTKQKQKKKEKRVDGHQKSRSKNSILLLILSWKKRNNK